MRVRHFVADISLRPLEHDGHKNEPELARNYREKPFRNSLISTLVSDNSAFFRGGVGPPTALGGAPICPSSESNPYT